MSRWTRVWRRRDERGATLLEVVTAVVIMGLIIAPLCVALNQAITIIPDASDRSAAAIDRAALVVRFADDIGQATSIAIPAANEVKTLACPPAGNPGANVPFIWVAWNAGGLGQAAIYWLRYTAVGTRHQVEVLRQTQSVAATPVLTGYCAPGEASVKVVRASADTSLGATQPSQYERVRASLLLRDTPEDSVRMVNLEGAFRKTPT